ATYRVYESCNSCPTSFGFQAMFNRMLGDGVTAISNSWGSCEPENTLAAVRGIDLVLQAASAAGVASFHASGDTGSPCQAASVYPNATDGPADAPTGSAVGGTTLQVGTGNAYQSESYWNSTCSGNPCSGGFGVSVFFPVPAYQAGLASGG